MRRLFTLLIGLSPSLSALANDPSFAHQGRLTDSLGTPVEGEHDLIVALHDDALVGSVCWEQRYDAVALHQGYFAVELAGTDALDRELGALPSTCRWLDLAIVGGASLGPRQRVPDYHLGQVALPLASATSAGIVEQATAAQIAAGTDIGETGAALFVAPSTLPTPGVAAPIPTLSSLDGTPQAVGLLSGATALSFSWTSGGLHTEQSGSNAFLGFATETTNRQGHELLDYTVQGNGVTYTPPAGTDRYLLVYISNQNGRDDGHNVTGVSFGGTPMTSLASLGTRGIVGGVDSGGHYIYGMALGSGDATPSGPITATFDGAGAATIQAHTLGNVDQTNPVAHTYASGHGATTNSSVSRGGFFHGTELEAYEVYAGQNTQGFVDTVGGLQHAPITAPGRMIRAYKSSTNNWSGYVAMVALRPSTSSTSAAVTMSGTVGGFADLTPGALYYLSDTVGGAISPIRSGPPVAIAVSDTEVVILPRD